MKHLPSNSIWHDAFHYVRPALDSDTHPMRFVVGGYGGRHGLMSVRHAPTAEAAEQIARDATKRLLKAQPELKKVLARSLAPVPVLGQGPTTNSKSPVSAKPAAKKKPGRKPKPVVAKLPEWSHTRFVCIRANSVTQIWRCHIQPGMAKKTRLTKDGKRGQEVPVPHLLHDLAVTILKETPKGFVAEPVREADGTIAVFKNIVDAENKAMALYYAADEEERFALDEYVVYRLMNHEIRFNPYVLGELSPFYVHIPYYDQPIFMQHSRPKSPHYAHTIKQLERSGKFSPQELIDIQTQRARDAKLNAEPTFTDSPQRYRSIEGALNAAMDHNRDRFQNRYLGQPGGGVPEPR